MKKMLYLMSLVALLFCYSCNSSESGGKKEQFLSFCKERMKIYEEGIDKMLAAEYPDEFYRICQVYNRRLEDSTKKASNSLSEEECLKLYESDADVEKAFDELKIVEAKFYNIMYDKKLEFGMN